MIGTVVTAIGAVVVGLFTRRSARDATAVSGFSALTERQAVELGRLSTRVQTLEQADVAHRAAAHKHERWDWEVAGKLRELGVDMPEPPPLYPE